ncbi:MULTISPECIES: PAS domain S-box protein [unclassified Yoonia]|uniref:hybrid sensor histidine kinase/response regulator n=1 Tax=unclassified Yoonia TaxID=2629118 RepID=UPI002B0021B0|nr:MULTISPECIES: PAS domain S-box protein [unclassified Yoonia]
MNFSGDSIFLSHPDPMWVYQLDTLRFLTVNNAAIVKYGYSREEFLAMTIADIRPDEDRAALDANVAAVTEGRDEAGVWRHRLKCGKIIYVDITGHTITYEGQRAELIASRDVSRFVVAEQSAREAQAREEAARQSSDRLARQFQIMFDSVPGMFLVFSPESYDVVAVSDAYLAALARHRHDVVGHDLFAALPLQPDDQEYAKLRGSFDRVVATGKPDLLEFQSFLLPHDEVQIWAVSSTPLAGPDNRILHLIMRMQDVTEAVDAAGLNSATFDVLTPERAKIDLVAHTRELKTENLYLAELATRLRSTQRLLGTGTWDYFVTEDRLEWSGNVYGMYGTTPSRFGHKLQDFIALVHPDDRADIRGNLDLFMASGDTSFSFAHMVEHSDGRVVHIQGMGELSRLDDRPVIRGVVQDITESVAAANALARSKRMLEIAGTSANFGAWRYDVLADRLQWSPQTARIHDEPDGFSPTLAGGIDYYVPEDRDRIARQFEACLQDGKSFNEIFKIRTAKGRDLSVRTTGEAERNEAGKIIALHGSFQDISELVAVRKRADQSERLLEIAGRAVKLGGWYVSLADQEVSWTDGVAAIHELPPGTRPTFIGGINFFAPEEHVSARAVFDACAEHGIPFDNVRDLITAKGNRIRVRSMGVPVRDATGKIIAVQGAMQDISELTAAQRKAGEASRRLVETLENIGDAFFTLDPDFRFTYLNSKAELLLKRKRDELLGRDVFDEFPEARGTAFEIEYRRAVETRQTARFEQFFAPLEITFRVSAHPTPAGLAVYFSDISEERRREEKLRLLGAAVAQINDIVLITEAEDFTDRDKDRIVFVNDAFERITGFSREEAIGQSPRMLQGPKSQRSELNRIRTALRASRSVRAELINYTKNGREYWLELDIVPLANEAGATTHFVAVQRDITDRRRTEEALRISETRFRLLAEATGNAAWEWDIIAGQLWWSDGMTKQFGPPSDPQDNLRSVWRVHVHPDDQRRVDGLLDRLLRGAISAIHERYRFRRADGSWADVEAHCFLICDDRGRAVRILGSMSDISERLAIEGQLRQSQKLEAVGQITGGVAHDFNNLLTVIVGSTEVLQEELEEGHPLRQYADICATAADLAAELTNRLLAFSCKQALRPQTLDVNAVITGIQDMLRRTLGENIDIKVVLAKNLWSSELDLAQLETAMLNLTVNSRDAMPNGGYLTIETANCTLEDSFVCNELGVTPGEYIVVTISDTGNGISKAQMERVFEPFFTTKGVGKGTGLGLSMVHGFVKQSKGHIKVYSEISQGTTIKMYFPRFCGQAPASGATTENSQVLRGQETILVVEDDMLILQQLVAQLADMGYDVITASAGAPALAILRDRADIDLLLTDIILPGGMNGRQIADAALTIRPSLKVLYTSGYSENAIVHHGRLDDGVELLSKPYRRSELSLKVRKVLDS